MKKVLIADDEEMVRSLVRMTLESADLQVFEASDGAEALAAARQHRPDIVLLDVSMPKMSGIDVCRFLKSDPGTHSCKVILLTAMAQGSSRSDGMAAGADDYFTKPFSPIALVAKIDSMLEGDA